jgi:hypothetical protein
MRIGVIACETFERGLEQLIGDDRDIIHKEYLEFGLHEYPEELKKAVIEKVNALEGKVDAVLLGYGICNSLREVTDEMKVPTVRLDADDCIGVLITPAEYEIERKKCAGTMYHTPYFARMNREWFEKEMRRKMPNYEEVGIDIDWYLNAMFNGYSRVLFIDDHLGNEQECMDLSKQFADELNLRWECREGTLSMLAKGIERTKELAEAMKKGDGPRQPPGASAQEGC